MLSSFLGTNKAGMAQGLKDSLINPFEIGCFTALGISTISFGFIPWASLLESIAPGIKWLREMVG